jgi:hypothetical protein
LVVVVGLLAGAADAAPILIVDAGGILQGATGVVVGSNTYDVSFVDGTCVARFSGCDQVTDFAFQTSGDADSAAQALMASVFVDGPAGNFDSSPQLIGGCQGSSFCRALVPYDISGPNFISRGASNFIVEANDSTSTTAGPINNDLSNLSELTWAVFTPAATPVPEPATLVLLGSSLGRQALGDGCAGGPRLRARRFFCCPTHGAERPAEP